MEQLAKRIENQDFDLGFKGSGEDKRVALNRSNHLLPSLEEIYRDLVRDGRHE